MFLNPALSEDGDRKWVRERDQIKTTSTSAIKIMQIQENINVKLMRALNSCLCDETSTVLRISILNYYFYLPAEQSCYSSIV